MLQTLQPGAHAFWRSPHVLTTGDALHASFHIRRWTGRLEGESPKRRSNRNLRDAASSRSPAVTTSREQRRLSFPEQGGGASARFADVPSSQSSAEDIEKHLAQFEGETRSLLTHLTHTLDDRDLSISR